jgi:hypothetical protein
MAGPRLPTKFLNVIDEDCRPQGANRAGNQVHQRLFQTPYHDLRVTQSGPMWLKRRTETQ